MPQSRKRKIHGKQVRMRPVSPLMLTAFSRGIRSLPARRCLDLAAVWDALDHLASQGRVADLEAIAASDAAECARWADRLAAEHPDDDRWDKWRSFRRIEMSRAN